MSWAVGIVNAGGGILHWDGTTWNLSPTPPITIPFSRAWPRQGRKPCGRSAVTVDRGTIKH